MKEKIGEKIFFHSVVSFYEINSSITEDDEIIFTLNEKTAIKKYPLILGHNVQSN